MKQQISHMSKDIEQLEDKLEQAGSNKAEYLMKRSFESPPQISTIL